MVAPVCMASRETVSPTRTIYPIQPAGSAGVQTSCCTRFSSISATETVAPTTTVGVGSVGSGVGVKTISDELPTKLLSSVAAPISRGVPGAAAAGVLVPDVTSGQRSTCTNQTARKNTASKLAKISSPPSKEWVPASRLEVMRGATAWPRTSGRAEESPGGCPAPVFPPRPARYFV